MADHRKNNKMKKIPDCYLKGVSQGKSNKVKTKKEKQEYEVKKKIGEGSYGVVYLIYSNITSMYYVQKKIDLKGLSKAEIKDTEKEVNLLKKLDHPNVIKLINGTKSKRYLELIMEYAEKGDLYNQLIKQAKRPLVLAGAGVILADACDEFSEFVHLINAPVMTSLLGKGAIDETDDLALGMLGMHGRKVSNDYINESDLLIAVGIRFVPDSKVIHIDIDPAEIGKNVEVDLPIVGDAKNILTSLNNLFKGYSASNDVNAWTNKIKQRKVDLMPRVTYDDIPLKPQSVIKEISEVLTADSILTTDVGQNQMWAAHFYDTQKPRKFISSGGLGTMGFGFPSAIGAKVACPEDSVVSLNGDGGFLMVCQELATVYDYDLPVIAIVLENRTLGMVYQWQSLLYDGRHSQTEFKDSPDFVKLAESFGINALKVEKPGETKEALKSAIKDNEAILIDIIIDSEEALPMLPPGAGINEMIGEYKLEKDVI